MKFCRSKAAGPAAVAAVLWVLALAASASHAQQMVSVSREEINMRSGPGTRFEAIWTLIRGYPLRVIGSRGRWLKVRDFEGDHGWVFRSLTGRTPYHVVKAQVANLRAQPSTRSRVLGRLSYGDILRTLGRRAGWVRVRHEDGTRGWVARNLLWGW
jgi:SH3-like domain-containing protein